MGPILYTSLTEFLSTSRVTYKYNFLYCCLPTSYYRCRLQSPR